MKKTIYTITGIILFSLFTFSQSITVRNPANGDVWAKNTAHTIEWRKSGEMGANVKIRLFRGSSRIKSITNSTPTRNENFRCPPNFFNDVPDGSYTIKVKTLNNNVSGNSAVFRIGSPPNNDNGDGGNNGHNFDSSRFSTSRVQGTKANRVNVIPAFIKIIHPNANTVWNIVGTTTFYEDIIWKSIGIDTPLKVRIYLKRVLGRGSLEERITITDDTWNNGYYLAQIRSNIETKHPVLKWTNTIVIETLDGKIRAKSKPFFLIHAGEPLN